jgi:hypothetical protein
LDGPLNSQIFGEAGLLGASLLSLYFGGAGWPVVLSSLGEIGILMGKAHKMYYLQYGLMVDESTGWDIYGYTNF